MTKEFTRESPVLNLTFDHPPEHWKAILAGWFIAWAAVTVAIMYAYAVILPSFIGVETTALVGIATIALTLSSKD